MYKKARRNLKNLSRSQRKMVYDAVSCRSRQEIFNRIIELDKEREAMEIALDFKREPVKKEPIPKFIMVEDWTLDELNDRFMLNTRGYNCMKEYGITGFKQILELGWDGLLEIPGIGWATRSACASKIRQKTGIILRGYPYD